MTEFRVGDKVTHDEHGDGEVTYGPYESALCGGVWAVARFDREGGKERSVKVSNLTPRPAFKVDDKAVWCDEHDVEILAGPFVGTDGTKYVVKWYRGTELADSDFLSARPSPAPLAVGDKIRILEDRHGYTNVKSGDVLTVNDVFPETFRTDAPRVPGQDWWVFLLCEEGTGWERVDADTETINGVTYEMGARYRDCDGDVWKFSRVGSAVRGCTADAPPDDACMTLTSAVRTFGPLTRVED